MNIKFDGLDQLVHKLKQYENANEIEKNALEAGAEFMRSEMAKVAPYEYGTLKENIIKTDIIDSQIFIGTEPKGDGFYGYFHEIGTSKMAARPWARPAFERNRNKIQQIMAMEIKKGMGL